MARGRKSAVSLAVVPSALPGERPAPPAELDDTEKRIWDAIVGALPPTWFDDAAQQVLVRAVAQASVCEGLEAQLRELRRRPQSDPDGIATLAAQHAAAAKALAHLLDMVRATPKSRMRLRGASRQLAQAPRIRPWEASDDG